MYHLLHTPHALSILRKELTSTTDLASPPSYQSVAKLPYLEAAIKEAQRMNIFTIDPLEREVHREGAMIAGVFIPGGTSVAVNIHAINRNTALWGEDADTYRPERWVEAEPALRSKMERSMLAFGAGKRMCIGQHIAWMEMKKALAQLVLRFDVRRLRC